MENTRRACRVFRVVEKFPQTQREKTESLFISPIVGKRLETEGVREYTWVHASYFIHHPTPGTRHRLLHGRQQREYVATRRGNVQFAAMGPQLSEQGERTRLPAHLHAQPGCTEIPDAAADVGMPRDHQDVVRVDPLKMFPRFLACAAPRERSAETQRKTWRSP